MKNKRVFISILLGALLGVICIIGISMRIGFLGNELFILSTWINRLIIGLVVGLAPYFKFKTNFKNVLIRGGIVGFIISGSFYLATSFKDTPGFIAGIIYGMIIDYIVTKYE